uniref:Uncharacterized protein n=1 Tax=Arundo donax TaxID=35708 RepID=A0A0A8YBS7_ARUDO
MEMTRRGGKFTFCNALIENSERSKSKDISKC